MKLDDFYPFVIPHVPNLPTPTVDHHLRIAALEFFQKTHAWQSDLDPQTTVIDQTDYDLDVPAGAQVCKILSVTVDERDYTKAVSLIEPASMAFECDAPQAGLPLKVRVALAPAIPASSWFIPDAMQRYAQDIAHGALSTLLLMVDGKEAMAPTKAAMFSERIKVVGIKVSRANSGKRLTRASAAQFF